MKVIVTGVAGFIGFHVAQQLLSDGIEVFGVDSLNSYYDPKLKHDRKSLLELYGNQFTFIQSDLYTSRILDFSCDPQAMIHLAAQAGVRYSTKNPKAYIDSNIVGTFNILEYCRLYRVPLLYASSSSVYGGNQTPWQEDMKLDSPKSLYAASKISNEVMVESYVNMFNLKAVGFRFFTVYGPWGRPDMVMWKWAKALMLEQELLVNNYGNMSRSFTYIDDIIPAIIKATHMISFEDIVHAKQGKGHSVVNLGNDKDENLLTLIEIMTKKVNKEPKLKFVEMPKGDVASTKADITKAKESLGFEPSVDLEEGVSKFLDWFVKEKCHIKYN